MGKDTLRLEHPLSYYILWEDSYINCHLLSIVLENLISTKNVYRYINENANAYFFNYCEEEFTKFHRFFYKKKAELRYNLDKLIKEMDEYQLYLETKALRKRKKQVTIDYYDDFKYVSDEVVKAKFKTRITKFYKVLCQLFNYYNINVKAFEKFMKTYDYEFKSDYGHDWLNMNINSKNLLQEVEQLDTLKEVIIGLVMRLGLKSPLSAQRSLELPNLRDYNIPFFSPFASYFLVAMLMLLFFVMYQIYLNYNSKLFNWRNIGRLYRSSFYASIYFFFLALNVRFWKTYGINYFFLFKMNPVTAVKEYDVTNMGVFFTFVFLLNFSAFLVLKPYTNRAYYLPMVHYLMLLGFLLLPTKRFYGAARYWLIIRTLRIAVSPILRVEFADYWLTDNLSPFQKLFQDFAFNWVFLIYNTNLSDSFEMGRRYRLYIAPFFLCIPYWIRFNQCNRRFYAGLITTYNFFGSFKYFLSLGAVVLTDHFSFYGTMDPNNPLRLAYVLVIGFRSCYVVYWDCIFDYKLIKNGKFRSVRLIHHTIIYFFGVCFSLCDKFSWILSFFLENHIRDIFEVHKLAHRGIWNMIRLENEVLNNIEAYRLITNITNEPLNEADQEKILGILGRKVRPVKQIDAIKEMNVVFL